MKGKLRIKTIREKIILSIFVVISLYVLLSAFMISQVVKDQLEGKYELEEGYNPEAAKVVKPALGDTPLLLVGGMRTVSHMEDVLENNHADFISMSRPFIRDTLHTQQTGPNMRTFLSGIRWI